MHNMTPSGTLKQGEAPPTLHEAGAGVTTTAVTRQVPNRSDAEGAVPTEEVVRYHSTPTTNLQWILQYGLFLSTKWWTISGTPFGLNSPDEVNLVLRMDSSRIDRTGLHDMLKPSPEKPAVPPDLLRHLERLNRYFLPQDTYHGTGWKPEWLRMRVSRAHNMLVSLGSNELAYITPKEIDLKATLALNAGRPCYPELERSVKLSETSGGQLSTVQLSWQARVANVAVDIVGRAYQLIPKWSTRAYRQHQQFLADAAAAIDRMRNRTEK